MPDDPSPILNLADAPAHEGAHGEHFAYSMSELASELDGRAIGTNVTRVPPGKAAFPIHHHHANEEHFFVLSGRGVLRVGERTYPVKPHDYIVHLPGGPETAHQLINDGREDLVYLAFSTRVLPDVVGYPDSNKTGVRIGDGQAPAARFLVSDEQKTRIGYWDGEDGKTVAQVLSGR